MLDSAGLLRGDQRARLELRVQRLARETGTGIAVLTVPTTEGEAIASFALRVFETWGVGQQQEDNGVLIAVTRDDRRMHIQVGYGLEGAIPDITANRIIEREMVPRFRNGDFGDGIEAAVLALEGAARGEGYRAPEPVPSLLFTSVLASLFALPFHRRNHRVWGALLGGLFSAGLTWFMTSLFAPWALLAFALGGALAWIGAGHGSARGRRWMPGGGWGGGFGARPSGGGGFGGFGRGSTGGGGASGSW